MGEVTDKELADKVVGLGVGEYVNGWFVIPGSTRGNEAKIFVRDWRVAGALLEKIAPAGTSIVHWHGSPMVKVGDPRKEFIENESLPRAIIEACVGALTNDQ